LQFNIVQTAVGLLDWRDFTHFDYLTYSPRPLDVACSWHFSVLMLALCGGDTGADGFQLLTQQYCLTLELLGYWEWAVYVALFVRNERARGALVRGLMQRNVAVPKGDDLRPASRRQWLGVPRAWTWRAQALRSEAVGAWPPAVASWLKCGGADRALVLALGFLQVPAILGHLAAQPRRGVAEAALSLEAMSPPARWLLDRLEEAEPSVTHCEEIWAEAGRDALALMRGWAAAGAAGVQYEAQELVRLCWRCELLRRQLLGVPW